MSSTDQTLLAYLVLPGARIEQTVERLKRDEAVPLQVSIRAVSAALSAVTGATHDVMRLIGGLAAEGESALLTAETI